MAQHIQTYEPTRHTGCQRALHVLASPVRRGWISSVMLLRYVTCQCMFWLCCEHRAQLPCMQTEWTRVWSVCQLRIHLSPECGAMLEQPGGILRGRCCCLDSESVVCIGMLAWRIGLSKRLTAPIQASAVTAIACSRQQQQHWIAQQTLVAYCFCV